MASEQRLIDANESYTLNATDNTGYNLCFGGGIISVMDERGHCVCEFDAEDAPAIEATPVVHGRCEYCKDGKSFIGARMLLGNDGKWHDINNCPNCGAKMDGDGYGQA